MNGNGRCNAPMTGGYNWMTDGKSHNDNAGPIGESQTKLTRTLGWGESVFPIPSDIDRKTLQSNFPAQGIDKNGITYTGKVEEDGTVNFNDIPDGIKIKEITITLTTKINNEGEWDKVTFPIN